MLPDQDIKEQIYKKNLELLQERRHTEQLLYSVSDIVFVVDKELRITIINHAARNILKLDPEIHTNMLADELIHLKFEKGGSITAGLYAFQVEPSKTQIRGLILETPYGDLYVNLHSKIIVEDGQQKECVITLSDVTKEKMLEKAKDEFVNIASHELRSPLSIIKSYLWMLSNDKGGKLSDKQAMYVKKAIVASDRLLALVNDYLNVARIEQGRLSLNMSYVDYPMLINEVYDEFKLKTDEKKLGLKLNVPGVMPKIAADSDKLREILINLVGNAVKFTEKGEITLSVEVLGGEVKTTVADTGLGIKEEDLGKLFVKFGRLDNELAGVAKVGGTGLGLYLCKSLVEKMGGRIGVNSEGEGKGAQFWFILQNENSRNTVATIKL